MASSGWLRLQAPNRKRQMIGSRKRWPDKTGYKRNARPPHRRPHMQPTGSDSSGSISGSLALTQSLISAVNWVLQADVELAWAPNLCVCFCRFASRRLYGKASERASKQAKVNEPLSRAGDSNRFWAHFTSLGCKCIRTISGPNALTSAASDCEWQSFLVTLAIGLFGLSAGFECIRSHRSSDA